MSEHEFFFVSNRDDGFTLCVEPPFEHDEPQPLYWSIKKWRAIATQLISFPGAEITGVGGLTCALCAVFRNCKDCPVAMDGHSSCLGTPYMEFMASGGRDWKVACAEAEYLEGLSCGHRQQERDIVVKRLRRRVARCLELAQKAGARDQHIPMMCLIAMAYAYLESAIELEE